MVTVVDTFLITSSGIPSVTIWLSTVRGFSWQALRPTAAQHAAKKVAGVPWIKAIRAFL